ncbi:hypothetical protein GCM10020000_52240 [Streptomyces olivoverticillatus]
MEGTTTALAVVGIDCAFPGAPDADAYWELLMRGGDAVGQVPPERTYPEESAVTGPGGFLAGADVFDNDFFSVPPARPPPWTRSSGCCCSAPGGPWRTPEWRPASSRAAAPASSSA